MTPNEFKAWFDGFTEAFAGRIPTKTQWGRIKDRVAEIDGKPTTQTVYVDRYINRYPYLQPYLYWGHGTCSTVGLSDASAKYSSALNNCSTQIGSGGAAFNASQAMADLGRAEAKAMAS